MVILGHDSDTRTMNSLIHPLLVLAQQVPDFFVYMTEEVHVRCRTVHSLVFYQEVVEPRFQLISLTNNSQLQGKSSIRNLTTSLA